MHEPHALLREGEGARSSAARRDSYRARVRRRSRSANRSGEPGARRRIGQRSERQSDVKDSRDPTQYAHRLHRASTEVKGGRRVGTFCRREDVPKDIGDEMLDRLCLKIPEVWIERRARHVHLPPTATWWACHPGEATRTWAVTV